jgi:hypothetical protein
MSLTVIIPDGPPPMPGPAGCRALVAMITRAYEVHLERDTVAGSSTPATVASHPSPHPQCPGDESRGQPHRTDAAA